MDSKTMNDGAIRGVKRKPEAQLGENSETETGSARSSKTVAIDRAVGDSEAASERMAGAIVHEEDTGASDNDADELSEDPDEMKEEFKKYSLTLPGSPPRLLTVKLSVTADPEFKSWMKTMYILCTHDDEPVGSARGRHINRERIRPFFYRDMEEPSQDMSCLAYDVFDRYGFLKKELKEHPVRKGTGKWGSELDHGIIFLIESIWLDREWRRHGLGTIMAKALMDKASKLEERVDFHLAIPGWLNTRDLDLELKDKTKADARVIRFGLHDAAAAFFRSLGFRRIGASGCLGLAQDSNHAARGILSTLDYEPEEPLQDAGNESDEEESDHDDFITHEQKMKEKRFERMQKTMPVHHAINVLLDTQCVSFLRDRLITQSITDPEWTKMDHLRNNVLHIAGCLSKPLTVSYLMENIDKDQKLRLARNIKGYTPLEALQAKLESSRISTSHGMIEVCISDKFSGFSLSCVGCLGVLHEIPNLSVGQLLRLKYGCTCGQCLSGFMSARMKFALLSEAEIIRDDLSWDILEERWCDWHEDSMTFVDATLRQNFRTNKSLRQGFTSMFGHIASCLRQDVVPTEGNVLKAWQNSGEWPPVTQNFLGKGGKVENSLRIVFDNARDQDLKAGDGNLMDTFGGEIAKLSECRNDHEFGFVALACGLREIESPTCGADHF